MSTVPPFDAAPVARSHAAIVRASSPSKLQTALASAGFDRLPSVSAIQKWADRNSIPQEYWQAIAELGLASLEELAAAADPRPATATPGALPDAAGALPA